MKRQDFINLRISPFLEKMNIEPSRYTLYYSWEAKNITLQVLNSQRRLMEHIKRSLFFKTWQYEENNIK